MSVTVSFHHLEVTSAQPETQNGGTLTAGGALTTFQTFSLATSGGATSSTCFSEARPISHWAMARLLSWAPCEPPCCTLSNESSTGLLLIPSCTAGAPQKPWDVCSTPADTTVHPISRDEHHQPFGLPDPFSAVCAVSFTPLPRCTVSGAFRDHSSFCLFLPEEIQAVPLCGSPHALPTQHWHLLLFTHGLTMQEARYLHAARRNCLWKWNLLVAVNLHGGRHVPHTCVDLLLLFPTRMQISALVSTSPN